MGLFSLFGKSNDFYVTEGFRDRDYREITELYKRIFDKLGIRFELLDDEICSGFELFEAGYENEVRKICRKNFNLFKEEGVQGIITTSPESYKMFLKHYPDIVFDWNISVLNIWGIILRELQRKPSLIKNPAMEDVCFHDNCYLGRGMGIYEEPRRILEVLGYEIMELEDNRENSFCCGSCGGLHRTNPDLANRIAKERILQVKRLGMKKLIVCSIENYDLLKKNEGETGVEILELSEIIAEALNIKKEKYEREEEIKGEEKVLDEDAEENIKEEDLYDEMEEKDDRL